ncbi:MAG: leucine-rich repeat domain-containing protein [Clostridiales bacterium]|nr:leucine-rich repeat domain-containing protein [Clostridiales bacterium]
MNTKNKILLGVLLCFAAATLRLPLSYVEAESASASDFQMKGNTLVKYTGTASTVSIPVSVKHIGKEAFSGHTELVKVEIPGYVESIDYNAFSGCSALEKAVIPDTVKEIGNGAFSECSSLKSVTLGKNLKTLGSGIFANCTSLSEIKLSKDNQELAYDSGVIYSKDKSIVYTMIPGYAQDTYKMPSTVKEIKNSAFWGCMKLKKVQIGSNVKKIPDYAFSNCQNLEKVMFSYSVSTIGLKAFADCINLGSIDIPVSVSSIHETAFDGCPRLTIIAEKGSYAAEYDAKRDKSQVAQSEYQDVEQNVEENDGGDNKQNNGSGSANVEANTGSMLGQSRIVGGSAVVFIDNSRSKVLSGNVQEKDTEQKSNVSSEVMGNGQMLDGFAKYTIVNNKKIAAQAYYGNEDLTEYSMPETIEDIGDFSFARTGLTSINIPEGVKSIGYGAFYHCDNLASVTIPGSVTTIEPSAFDKTEWMEGCLADKRNPFTIVGDGILIAYAGEGDTVEVPEGVKQIGAEVFKGNTEITSVTLPDTCLSIGEDAFAGCSNLTSVLGGIHLEEIKDRAFSGCPISTIKIPASVEKMGLKAYDITGTIKPDGSEAAVFLGTDIPEVSYEKTATRLINEEERDAVLKGVNIAIVDDSVTSEDVKGTVLDYDMGGFRGLVCSVEQAATDNTQGRLRIKFIVMRKEDIDDNTIPGKVTVYGKSYKISNPREAVEYISGSQEETSEEGRLAVEVNSSTVPDKPVTKAQLTGIKKNYILKISDNTSAGDTISAAYKKSVQGGKIVSLQVYDVMLYDAKTMLPISKTGKQAMTVTIPKPMGVAADGLRVVCLDEDGQLEKVESHLVTVDGVACVQFIAERFTAYGFYN